MTFEEKLDYYDSINRIGDKEKYFEKNIYPYYLYIIYKYLNYNKYKILLRKYRIDNSEIVSILILKLLFFQSNRKKYDIKNYHAYIRGIIVNGINDYLLKEIPYKKYVILYLPSSV